MVRYKLVIGVLLVLCLQPIRALAQGGEPPIPPAPNGGNVVLDTLDWLTPSQETEINSINQKLDEEGIAQIAVVTLDDCGGDKQKFRNELLRTWGIGHANDNDGLLIMVCWYGGDQSRRSLEQETGFGLEGTLPDVLTARVADELFIPAFQADQPGNGLVAMVIRYDRILRQGGQTSQSTQSQPSLLVQQAAASTPVNTNFAFLLIGILGSVPGLALSTIYASVWKSGNKLATNAKKGKKKIAHKNELLGVRFPWLYQLTLAEIISLIPILAILYISRENIPILPFPVRDYSAFIFPYLLLWFFILVIFYPTKFFTGNSGGNWSSGHDSWGSGGGTFGGGNSGDSFGGGDSGGGGSSTKF